MKELSLNILDVAKNSVRAGASLIEIALTLDEEAILTFAITDNGCGMEEVYGVATFYSQFVLNPKGDVAIAVCLGTACYVKGSGEILEKITQILGLPAGSTTPDGKYSLEATRCIGACGLAPVLTINNEVYGRLVPSDMEGILAKYK